MMENAREATSITLRRGPVWFFVCPRGHPDTMFHLLAPLAPVLLLFVRGNGCLARQEGCVACGALPETRSAASALQGFVQETSIQMAS